MAWTTPITVLLTTSMLSAAAPDAARERDRRSTTATMKVALTQQSPEEEWQKLPVNAGHTVALTRRNQTPVKGQMVNIGPDGLMVLAGNRAIRVDRENVCDVTTYQSALRREAKYAGAFGGIGIGVGVLSWLGKNLGDQGSNAWVGTWAVSFKNSERLSGYAVGFPVDPNGYGVVAYVLPQPPCESGSVALLGLTLFDVAITTSRLTGVSARLVCSGSQGFGTLNLSKQ